MKRLELLVQENLLRFQLVFFYKFDFFLQFSFKGRRTVWCDHVIIAIFNLSTHFIAFQRLLKDSILRTIITVISVVLIILLDYWRSFIALWILFRKTSQLWAKTSCWNLQTCWLVHIWQQFLTMTHCWLVASHLIEKIVQVNIVWRIVLLKLQNVAEKLVHLRSSFQQVRIKKLCRLADGLKLGFFHFFLIAN